MARDDAVVVIASGPSLTKEDVDYCRGKAVVMVVNDNYRIAPWADFMFAADFDWWLSTPHGESDPNHALSAKLFNGERHTCDIEASKRYGLRHVEHKPEPEPWCVWGSNSGIEALQLAQMAVPNSRYLLLGFDMGASGNTHWFGAHPKLERIHPITKRPYVANLERTASADFPAWCKEFEAIQGDVINCSRTTALTCFPRAAIQDAL